MEFQSSNIISEMRLLALLSSPRLDIEHIYNLLADFKPDIQTLYELILHHELLLLVYPRLKHITEFIEIPDIGKWRETFLRRSRNNLEQLSFYLFCSDVLTKNRVPFISYKGPVLSVQAYNNDSFRSFTDIDLLIQPDDFPRVYDILIKEGFTPEFLLSQRQILFLVKGNSEFKFLRKGFCLEIHWSVDEREYIYPIPSNYFWNNANTTLLFNRTLLTLSIEDTFLFLCIHGSKHRWSSMKWAVDLAHLSYSLSGNQWQNLYELGKKWGFLYNLSIGGILANALGGRAFSNYPLVQQPDHSLSKLVDVVIEAWQSMQPIESYWTNVIFYLRSRERFKHRLLYLLMKAVNFKKEDWLAFPLPYQLKFLYAIYRPIRILAIFGLPFFRKS